MDENKTQTAFLRRKDVGYGARQFLISVVTTSFKLCSFFRCRVVVMMIPVKVFKPMKTRVFVSFSDI